MKGILKVFLASALFLTALFGTTQLAQASVVEQGFYVKNELKYTVGDFINGTKKEKKQILKFMIKNSSNGQIVAGGKVYPFLEAIFEKVENLGNKGTPIDEYVEKNGPLKNPEAVENVSFEIISID